MSLKTKRSEHSCSKKFIKANVKQVQIKNSETKNPLAKTVQFDFIVSKSKYKKIDKK